MFIFLKNQKKNFYYRCSSILITCAISVSLTFAPAVSYAQSMMPMTSVNLPIPGAMVPMTAQFDPIIVKGITLYPDNPLEFDFIINPGDTQFTGEEFKQESTKLIKYFLAALTVPEEEMWVNLSPYEKDRIIPEMFGQTEMGRDLLAQDYLLKQLTASLMNPEDDLGEKFWTRIYNKANELYGTTEIPMNTFNKVWIVPEKAAVYQSGTNAFVVDSHLKVLLEEDYLALDNAAKNNSSVNSDEIITGIQSEIIREILIPEIEKEVNEGKTFANLRQIYHSMILATWYKQNLKESFLGKIYVNKHKTEGINTDDPLVNEKIYDQYVEAFEKGVYNFIKEDYDPHTQTIIPRKYFSGGVDSKALPNKVASSAITDDNLDTQSFALRRKVEQLVGEDDVGVNINLRGVSGGTEISLLPEVSDQRLAAASPIEETQAVQDSSDGEDGIIPESNAYIRWAEVVGYVIAFPFHATLITGLLFMLVVQGDITLLDFLKEFFMSFVITGFGGGSQLSLHEMGHLNKATEVRSLKDKDLEKELIELKQKSLYQRTKRTIGTFLGIPFGLVRGIEKDGLSYKAQTTYNLYSEAWGVRGDRIRSRFALPVGVALISTALFTGYWPIMITGQVILAHGIASWFSYKVNDPGQLVKLDERLQMEADQKLALDQKEREGGGEETEGLAGQGALSGGTKSEDLKERDKNWGGRLDDLKRIYEETGEAIETVKGRASLLYERYRGRREWDVVLRMPYQIMNVFNGGAHADKRFVGNTKSLQEGMYNPRGAKNGNQAQEWGDKLAQALQDEVEESDGIFMGLADEGGMAAYVEGKVHPMDRDDVLGQKMAKIPEVQIWRLMAQAIKRAGLRPWVDVTMAIDGAATQLEDEFRSNNEGEEETVGKYYFYKAQSGEAIVLSAEEMIEMVRRMIVDYDVPITSIEDLVSERDLEGQALVNKQFKGLARVVVDDAAVTNSINVERIVENGEGDTLLVKPNQIGDRLGLWEALVTAAGKGLRLIFSHRSQSPIDLMEPEGALGYDAEGMKVGGAKTNTRVEKRQGATDSLLEFEERIAQLEKGGIPKMTKKQKETDELLRRIKKEELEITRVEVLRGNVNTSLPTAKVIAHFGIPGSFENQSVYSAKALTPVGASDGLGEAVHVVDSTFSRQEIPEGTKYMQFFKRLENGSFKFDKESASREKIEETGNDELIALFERSLPFNGKNIEVALARFKEQAADLLIGMKYSDLVNWQSLDELIQQRELQLYRKFEQKEREREEADGVPQDERLPERTDEEIILRKAHLGMQNILASSFARNRLAAQLHGLTPWELTRWTYREGLAKVIADNGGLEIIPEAIRNEMVTVEGEEPWETIEANLSLDELREYTQIVNQSRKEGVPYYQIVRDALGISFVEKPAAASSPLQAREETPGGIDLDAAMLNLQVEQGAGENPFIRMNHFPIPDVDIGGLVPVIIHVSPVNVGMLLGLADEEDNSQELSYYSPDKMIGTRRRLGWQNKEYESLLN